MGGWETLVPVSWCLFLGVPRLHSLVTLYVFHREANGINCQYFLFINSTFSANSSGLEFANLAFRALPFNIKMKIYGHIIYRGIFSANGLGCNKANVKCSFSVIKKYSDSEPHVGISGISSFMPFLALKMFSVSLKSVIFAFTTVLF